MPSLLPYLSDQHFVQAALPFIPSRDASGGLVTLYAVYSAFGTMHWKGGRHQCTLYVQHTTLLAKVSLKSKRWRGKGLVKCENLLCVFVGDHWVNACSAMYFVQRTSLSDPGPC